MQARLLYILMILLVASPHVFAQSKNTNAKDTVIKGATIEITQSYKPEVKQAPKPIMAPALPLTDTTRPTFTYEIPQQTLYYTYNSLPLRPLALGKDSMPVPFANYLKIGGGNLSTIYVDAGIGSITGRDYETAFHIRHMSQSGSIKYQQSSLSGLDAEGTLHRNGNAWHTVLNADRSGYYYYGYNHTLYAYSDKDSLKQAFTGVHLTVDMKNEGVGYKNFNYHPFVTVSAYGDSHDANEKTFGLGLPVSYDIDTTLQLYAAINGTFTYFSNSLLEFSNNIVQITPGLRYHAGAFRGHAYLSPTIGKGGSLYILPDLAAAYSVRNTPFEIKAGWQALLRQNTYEQLSKENPFLFNAYTLNQTRSDEVYGSIGGSIGHHISYSAKVSWWRYDALPVFLNKFGDQKQFNVVYDYTLNATSLQAVIRYQQANTFAVGLSGTFYSFYNGSISRPWHVPGVRINGDVMFHPLPALTVTAYLSFLDKIYAQTATGATIKLDPIMDLGGYAEYSFIPRLSAFIQINNLLNNTYERWLGYQAYGFNIYGGIRLKF